jgi:hypothetical protein
VKAEGAHSVVAQKENSMKKQVVTVLAGCSLAFTLTGYASAADCQKKIALTSTGIAPDASGGAKVRARRVKQSFSVEAEANVPDGATYMVFANGQPAGMITMVLGEGELELNNNNGKVLPAGVDPVCSITSVVVVDSTGATVLEGSFSSSRAATRGRGADDPAGDDRGRRR